VKAAHGVSGAVLVLVAVAFMWSCASTRYVPKADEELYGTWTNDQLSEYKKVVFAMDSAKWYYSGTSSEAAIEAKLDITAKWTDSEGNTWYKGVGTITGGSMGDAGTVLVMLYRLSKSAAVLELVYSFPSNEQELKNPVYPKTIDPKAYAGYGYYNRS